MTSGFLTSAPCWAKSDYERRKDDLDIMFKTVDRPLGWSDAMDNVRPAKYYPGSNSHRWSTSGGFISKAQGERLLSSNEDGCLGWRINKSTDAVLRRRGMIESGPEFGTRLTAAGKKIKREILAAENQ